MILFNCSQMGAPILHLLFWLNMAIADRWLNEKRTAVLVVPSAVVPQENNYLLNPEHPDFEKIAITTPEPFTFDSRMWK